MFLSIALYLRRMVSNSVTPCSMTEREESSQATFILAFSTRDFGRTIVSRASSVGGGDMAKDQSEPYWDPPPRPGVPPLLNVLN